MDLTLSFCLGMEWWCSGSNFDGLFAFYLMVWTFCQFLDRAPLIDRGGLHQCSLVGLEIPHGVRVSSEFNSERFWDPEGHVLRLSGKMS
jgi:hypothetical protein